MATPHQRVVWAFLLIQVADSHPVVEIGRNPMSPQQLDNMRDSAMPLLEAVLADPLFQDVQQITANNIANVLEEEEAVVAIHIIFGVSTIHTNNYC